MSDPAILGGIARPLLFVGTGCILLLLLIFSGIFLMRDMRRQERFAARVRVIHGQKPLSRASEAAASATGAISCGVRRSAVNLPPERASRASVTRSVLSSTLGLIPGSTVWMTPTRTG